MKKHFLLFLIALLPIVASAYDAEIDGIYYNFSEDRAVVTYQKWQGGSFFSDYSGAVVIPSSVTYNGKTYSVTGIGGYAFNHCSGLTSVTIPSSVTSIGISAFMHSDNLFKIHISDIAAWCEIEFAEHIVDYDESYYLYLNDEEIKDLIIPDGVTKIGDYTFFGCSSLTSVTVPNSVTSIGNYAFYKCSDLTSVTIPNSVTSIGSSAFYGCSSLTTITIPGSVTSIEYGAFSHCSRLTSVTIGSGVTSIGNETFADCRGLTSVIIPNSVTSIGNSAFNGCYFISSFFVNNSTLTSDNNWGATICDEETSDGLLIKENIVKECRPWTTVVTIPEGVTSIGNGAFKDCSGLTFITIPNSVKSIGFEAFWGCSGLTSVMIPESVTTIGDNAFDGCTSLTSITIPNSVTDLGYEAFEGCTSLTSVKIGNSVARIMEFTFLGCNDLTTIVVEDGNTIYDSRNNSNAIIETLSNTLIAGCKNTTIPNTVTSIGVYAFSECCGLTSIMIPSSVTSIEDEAFSGCTSLTNVISEIEEPYAFGSSAFGNISNNCVLKVPAGTRDAYIAAGWTEDVFKGGVVDVSTAISFADAAVKAICVANWDTNSDGELSYAEAAAVTDLGTVFMYNADITSFNELQYFTGLEDISDRAFRDCSGLTSVTIPGSVTSIGDGTFWNCTGLTSVTIPNSVTSIGADAFWNCTGLTSITIPNSVTSIGADVFQNCTGLTSIIVESENLVYMSKDGVLYNKAGTTLITYPEGKSNTSYAIPNSVTSIGDWAFYGCYLTSITIPNSVTSIGDYAFYGSGLTSVTIPNSVTSIGEYNQEIKGVTNVEVIPVSA